MRLFILKDGTIPLAVVKAVAEDAAVDWKRYADELAESDAHEYVEMFEVGDETRILGVAWSEGMGFEVVGWPLSEHMAAFEWLNNGATDEAIAGSNLGNGHWAITYGEGDDESYGHLFELK